LSNSSARIVARAWEQSPVGAVRDQEADDRRDRRRGRAVDEAVEDRGLMLSEVHNAGL